MNDKTSPLTREEKDLIREWRNISSYAGEDLTRSLPKSFMNLWIGQSGVSLVRHPDFLTALQDARKAKAAADATRAAELKRQEQEDKARRYYSFWHYRGTAYAVQKYKERSGDVIFPVVELFLKRNGLPDHQIKIYKYDLPIANGHEIAVVYGSLATEKAGNPILYINYNLGRKTTLQENFSSLAKKRPFYPRPIGITPLEELEEFLRRAKL